MRLTADAIREAMIEAGRSAQYVAGLDSTTFKRGRGYQVGWVSGARCAVLALQNATGVPIPASATDYLQNADEINKAARKRAR